MLGEFQRWINKLIGYEFEIQYRLGVESKVADALSRISPKIELFALTFSMMMDVQMIAEQVGNDPQLSQIK